MAIKLTEIKRQAGVRSNVAESIDRGKTQVELVKDSFAELSKQGEALSTRFYERFFLQYPQIVPLFEGVSTTGQQKKFLASLVLIVQSLDQKEIFNDYLLGLSERHIHYGVKKEYYPMIVENLLAVFAEFSGKKWTAQLSQAWENTLNSITAVMLSAYTESDNSEVAGVSEDIQAPQSWDASLLNAVTTAVMMIDRDGNITFANQSAIDKLTQYRSELQPIIPDLNIDKLVGSNVNHFPKTLSVRWASLSAPERLPYKTELEVGPLLVHLTMTAVIDERGKYIGTALEWEEQSELADTNESSNKMMSALLDSLEAMSKGDLTKRLSDFHDNDFTLLQASINSELDKIAQQITESSDNPSSTGQASVAISEASKQLGEGIEDQLSLLRDNGSILEALTSSLQQNIANANSATQFSSELLEQAENGSLTMTQAIESITVLNTSTQGMADLITNIEQMAFQTNLLGLNAAVEATHAGEQGRGMAVIAAEIRSFAKQITAQAQDIKDLINANEASMQQSYQLVDKSGHSILDIVTGSEKVNEIASEIAAVATEQTQKIEQINKALAKVNELAESNTDIVKQISDTDIA